nr:DNA-directed RNA polymerase II subunit RPB1-like [Bactrocera oleae]
MFEHEKAFIKNVVLPCNLQRKVWNVRKIFHIDKCISKIALSLGKRATQITLNPFHFVGVSSNIATLGVRRREG